MYICITFEKKSSRSGVTLFPIKAIFVSVRCIWNMKEKKRKRKRKRRLPSYFFATPLLPDHSFIFSPCSQFAAIVSSSLGYTFMI